MRRRIKALIVCGVVSGLVMPFCAVAASPVMRVALSPTAAPAKRAEDQRLVTFFFSDRAWGGMPFTEAQKQHVIASAMLSGKTSRIEDEVTHLLSAPEARVRRFAAVFEVDGSVRPPKLHSGYELELLVPHSRKPLSVELENAVTGIVNRVEVKPDGSL